MKTNEIMISLGMGLLLGGTALAEESPPTLVKAIQAQMQSPGCCRETPLGKLRKCCQAEDGKAHKLIEWACYRSNRVNLCCWSPTCQSCLPPPAYTYLQYPVSLGYGWSGVPATAFHLMPVPETPCARCCGK